MTRLIYSYNFKKQIINNNMLELDLFHIFNFTTRIVQFLFFLNPKFPASGHLLCLYSSVCVGPVQKPHCWFSRDGAHLPNMHLNKACDEQLYMTVLYCTYVLGAVESHFGQFDVFTLLTAGMLSF